jgi:hypothetical protein
MTSTDGVYIDGKRTDSGDCSGPKSARNVLLHPDVDAAVFETARGGVLREGLGFDMCDVAVVTNIGLGDHLGLNYITTVDELAVVKRVIVENVAPTWHCCAQRSRPSGCCHGPPLPRRHHLLCPRPHEPRIGNAPRPGQTCCLCRTRCDHL